MQKFTRMIAALNGFISKCSNICYLFFQPLKSGKQLKWTEECDKTLADLKEYLVNPPLISIPKPYEQLYLHLSTSSKSINAALIRDEDMIQKPFYHVSKSLVGPKINYLPLEKLVFTLVITSRKLRYYFDAHPIKVLTSHPIRATLRKSDLSDRMEKWSVELNIFHINYEPRTTIKGHVLTDFITEFYNDAVA